MEEARTGLMKLLDVDEVQANAILDMQLRRIAACACFLRKTCCESQGRERGLPRIQLHLCVPIAVTLASTKLEGVLTSAVMLGRTYA